MITFAAGLLVVVLKNELDASYEGHDLFGPSEYDSASCPKPSYIINYSATTVAILASLISKAAAYLSVPLMTLLSFKVACILMKISIQPHANQLPSPFQIGLLINILTGGATSMWNSARYAVGWPQKRVEMPFVVKLTVTVLPCIMFLRYVKFLKVLFVLAIPLL
jgi:hypothetical protein